MSFWRMIVLVKGNRHRSLLPYKSPNNVKVFVSIMLNIFIEILITLHIINDRLILIRLNFNFLSTKELFIYN